MHYSEIYLRFKNMREEALVKKEQLEFNAERARQSAVRYQEQSAKKMTEYHRIRKRIADTTWVSWVKEVVAPLVGEVNRRTGLHFDTSDLRTYGIRAECPVFHVIDEEGENKSSYSLVFTPDFSNGRFRLFLDNGEKIRKCARGSIAKLNGMDNAVDEVLSVSDIIANLEKRYQLSFSEHE